MTERDIKVYGIEINNEYQKTINNEINSKKISKMINNKTNNRPKYMYLVNHIAQCIIEKSNLYQVN